MCQEVIGGPHVILLAFLWATGCCVTRSWVRHPPGLSSQLLQLQEASPADPWEADQWAGTPTCTGAPRCSRNHSHCSICRAGILHWNKSTHTTQPLSLYCNALVKKQNPLCLLTPLFCSIQVCWMPPCLSICLDDFVSSQKLDEPFAQGTHNGFR